MARKSASFGIVIHIPEDMDYARMQKKFDDFHIAQVKKKLSTSDLERKEKIEIIDRLIVQHSENLVASA